MLAFESWSPRLPYLGRLKFGSGDSPRLTKATGLASQWSVASIGGFRRAG